MEQRLASVRPPEPFRNLRDVLRAPGKPERLSGFGPDVRQHDGARPCLGGGRKRGQEDQALGRSRGGFSTKIHLKTDLDGHPLAFDLTGRQAADAPRLPILLDLGPEEAFRAALADKGYDSAANRQAIRDKGAVPAIPFRKHVKARPAFFPKLLYKARAHIEQTIGKLKRFKLIALRCEKTARNFRAFIEIAATFICGKSVYTT